MPLNILAILLAAIAQFAIGAVWYSSLFGNLWAKMHGFEKLSKKAQEKMMSQMPPIYGAQFVVTLVSTGVLAFLISVTPADISAYFLAFLLWLGFVVPAQASAAMFGGAQDGWITTKVAVQAGNSLVGLQVAALILQLLG